MELEAVFSVSEFNEMVDAHLSLLGEVVVEGEISELKVSQNKWVYLTLKDEEASLNVFGTVFQIRNLRELEVGMKVKVRGRPSLYQKTARFSLNAWEIVPSGEGALKAAYEKLRRELAKEGLFDPERKRPLPQFPERIGLITAKNSQAYNDFVKVVSARMGGLKICFYPVQVQGREAVETILEALNFFNETKKVDVLVITRGGGSLEDLAAFNDERVTRAVFASQIPTVCAIGHEGDVSLVELAADLRASTPSNAAELVVRDRREVIKEVDWWIKKMELALKRGVAEWQRKVDVLVRSIELKLRLSWQEVEKIILKFERWGAGLQERIRLYLTQVEGLEQRLKSLNPERLLQRGFSIVQTLEGKVVNSVKELDLKEEVVTLMKDGRLRSKITAKEET